MLNLVEHEKSFITSGPGLEQKNIEAYHAFDVDATHEISLYTVEVQWLEHLRDNGNMFEIGVVRASEC